MNCSNGASPSSTNGGVSELAAKAREGALDAEETVAIEAFERVDSFLGLVKSKARRSIQNHPGA